MPRFNIWTCLLLVSAAFAARMAGDPLASAFSELSTNMVLSSVHSTTPYKPSGIVTFVFPTSAPDDASDTTDVSSTSYITATTSSRPTSSSTSHDGSSETSLSLILSVIESTEAPSSVASAPSSTSGSAVPGDGRNETGSSHQSFNSSGIHEKLCQARGLLLSGLPEANAWDCIRLALMFGTRPGHYIMGDLNNSTTLGKFGSCTLQIKAATREEARNNGTWLIGNIDAVAMLVESADMFNIDGLGSVEGDVWCKYVGAGARKLNWRVLNTQVAMNDTIKR